MKVILPVTDADTKLINGKLVKSKTNNDLEFLLGETKTEQGLKIRVEHGKYVFNIDIPTCAMIVKYAEPDDNAHQLCKTILDLITDIEDIKMETCELVHDLNGISLHVNVFSSHMLPSKFVNVYTVNSVRQYVDTTSTRHFFINDSSLFEPYDFKWDKSVDYKHTATIYPVLCPRGTKFTVDNVSYKVTYGFSFIDIAVNVGSCAICCDKDKMAVTLTDAILKKVLGDYVEEIEFNEKYPVLELDTEIDHLNGIMNNETIDI